MGLFGKEPTETSFEVIFDDEDYICKTSSYNDGTEVRKTVLEIDLTESFQALYPTAGITRAVRRGVHLDNSKLTRRWQRSRKAYFCKNCGFEAPKWLGKCPSCGEWNTFTEEIIARESGSVPADGGRIAACGQAAARARDPRKRAPPYRYRQHGGEPRARRRHGPRIAYPARRRARNREINPLAADRTGRQRAEDLYVSGEESAEQIKMRALRIGIGNDDCMIYPETLLENIVAQIAEQKPDLVVIDSIQTIYTDLLDSSAGSVSQIRECAATLLKYAKTTGNVDPHHRPHHQATARLPVRRSSSISSMSSCSSRATATTSTASCAASRTASARRSRSVCSRCSKRGLRGVDNPSEILLTHYEEPLSGIAVGAAADGVRPYLIEVQALVSGAAYGTPQRTATDSTRGA